MESDTDISDNSYNTSQLIPFITKLQNNEDLIQNLQQLRAYAKGNDAAKGFIGENILTTLVKLVRDEDNSMEVRIEAAKLLRSITVYSKNKALGKSECESIIYVLSNTDNRDLILAIAATIWNLSALAENRTTIVERHGINAIAKLLDTDDLGLQKEAVGALRNITIGEQFRDLFANSDGLLDKLVKLLGKSTDIGLQVCIAGALKNLALSQKNHPLLSTDNNLNILIEILKSDNTKLQNIVLTVLTNLTQSSEITNDLGKKFTKTVYEPLLNSTTPSINESTLTLLKSLNISNLPQSQADVISEVLRDSGLMESAKYGSELLKKLNLDSKIKYEDVTLVKKIGEGQYGDVWLAKFHDFPVACKILKKQLTSNDAEKTLEELKLMSRLKHPNVVLLMGAYLNEQQQICIITEYASRGDLRSVAPQIKSLAKRLKLGLDIATGLAWLHAHNIVHRDLKLPNLLVFEDWTVKIGDLGLSVQLEEGVSINRFGGNVKYSAPEILRARYNDAIAVYPYSEKTDVYSYGLMLWELITLKPLFVRPKEYQGKKGLTRFVLEGNRPPLEKHWPENLQSLLSACWNEDPTRRPLFREIVAQWDTITTEILCPDKHGHEVVKILFTDKERVSFQEFLQVFTEVCISNNTGSTRKLYTKYLSVLLCESTFDDTVSKPRFCNVIGWFGPIDKASNCTGFFGRLKDLFSKRYFHGFLSEAKAENQLKQVWESTSFKQSYYVVRFSESDVGGFILSFINISGQVQHEKITNKNGNLYVEGICEEFDSWKKVKNAFKQVWNIGCHLPKGPYSNLYKKKIKQL